MREVSKRAWVAAVIAVTALSSAGCRSGPDICDDVGASVGGCDPNQPSFTATSCEGLAREFGQQLDERLVPIFEGPEFANDESQAVRAGEMQKLVVVRMNQYMHRNGIACEPDQMLADAEPHLSAAFREHAPDYIDDGDIPYDWDDYRADLLDDLQLIVPEES